MAVVEAEDTIELLRESVRGTLRRQWPVDQAVRLQRDPTALRDAWQVAASQGWTALGSQQTAAWAVIVEETDILTPKSLPEFAADPVDSAIQGQWTLEELESRYIRQVLRKTRSNYSRAAEILGINRKTLLEKRRKYGIE